MNAFGGYVDNPNDSVNCRYCEYSVSTTPDPPGALAEVNQVGDQYFEPLNIRYENRWRDTWILFCFFSKLDIIHEVSRLTVSAS